MKIQTSKSLTKLSAQATNNRLKLFNFFIILKKIRGYEKSDTFARVYYDTISSLYYYSNLFSLLF